MESISTQRWSDLIDNARDVLKIELRDYYGTDAAVFDNWRSGDLDAVTAHYRRWLEYFTTAYMETGRSFNRVRVVSEPLSDYQRMAVIHSGITVDAGEGLRWLPRRLVSVEALPGNDCLILDDSAVVFNVLDADASELVEAQYSTEPDVVKFCRDAFDRAWRLAVPHHEYRAQTISA
ncbi:hypothetical protein DPM19_02330 [Actinomadura craniellae]|uniref:DUF6879 domain-containing protein n=1 Tax=Actinomadura craniellae TaxID=2231787 RepID=A0A365HD13_9ACTN|nr:DUF6879 family protein [Actinomadura craniellae]RAY17020.1 hypothetical protein DPM19_02330 [Actinomadura craniellae]